MAEFRDATTQSWLVEIDGLVLAELREKAAVDIVQDGLYALEEREDVLTKALLILCREQIDARKLDDKAFSKRIAGNVIDLALAAVRGAAEVFFPPKRWSEIQSRSEKKREADEIFRDLLPMLELLNRPQMPEAMREAVMAAIAAKIETATSSDHSMESPSVSGQLASRLSAAGVSLDLSDYTPVA